MTTGLKLLRGRTEFIDESGNKFKIQYVKSSIADRDSLWTQLAQIANGLRLQIRHDLDSRGSTEIVQELDRVGKREIKTELTKKSIFSIST